MYIFKAQQTIIAKNGLSSKSFNWTFYVFLIYSFKIWCTLQERILSSTSSSKLLINDFILNMIMISTLLFVPGKVTWMIHSCLTQKYTYLRNFFHTKCAWNSSAQTCGTSVLLLAGQYTNHKWKQHNAFPFPTHTVDYSKSSDTCSESAGEAENESWAFPGSAHTHTVVFGYVPFVEKKGCRIIEGMDGWAVS